MGGDQQVRFSVDGSWGGGSGDLAKIAGGSDFMPQGRGASEDDDGEGHPS